MLATIATANAGHAAAYGSDEWTRRLAEIAIDVFGPGSQIFPVYNGTASNVLALQSMLPRWGAVIAGEKSHINADEAGASEKVGGIKIYGVPTIDGKITPEAVSSQAWGWGNEHRAQPLVVSMTQSTEYGTVYSLNEMATIADHAHSAGMVVHVDGARLANAAASLGSTFRELTRDVGVDVVSFGGTKNGALAAEAIVVLNPEASAGLDYTRMMNMQLASKMRFLSAQFIALLTDDLALRNARHANAMATLLRNRIEAGVAAGTIHGVSFGRPTQANSVFARLPYGVSAKLRQRFQFHDWDENLGEVRWVCSFDTTEADVAELVTALENATG